MLYVVCCMFIVHCSLFIVHCSLFIVHCSRLHVVCCMVYVVCCMLHDVWLELDAACYLCMLCMLYMLCASMLCMLCAYYRRGATGFTIAQTVMMLCCVLTQGLCWAHFTPSHTTFSSLHSTLLSGLG
jgi:hypothetical protein